MNKYDFKFFLFACPFLGAFIAFILALVLNTGGPSSGVMIMLGIIAGFLLLIVYFLWILSSKANEDNNIKGN